MDAVVPLNILFFAENGSSGETLIGMFSVFKAPLLASEKSAKCKNNKVDVLFRRHTFTTSSTAGYSNTTLIMPERDKTTAVI